MGEKTCFQLENNNVPYPAYIIFSLSIFIPFPQQLHLMAHKSERKRMPKPGENERNSSFELAHTLNKYIKVETAVCVLKKHLAHKMFSSFIYYLTKIVPFYFFFNAIRFQN